VTKQNKKRISLEGIFNAIVLLESPEHTQNVKNVINGHYSCHGSSVINFQNKGHNEITALFVLTKK